MERWRNFAVENFQRFRFSADFRRLRRKALRVLQRTTLFTGEEWWETPMVSFDSVKYRALKSEYRVVGAKYGVSEFQVELACLLRRYNPEESGLVLEFRSPKVYLVTSATSELFMRWLMYEAWQLGLYVHVSLGGHEMPLIAVPFPDRPEEPLTR